ncbi:predicted protein [Methanosarcina acetivorans C2A]|uniref:Uncharacterized protein n=1 Tax=Methanosarcina acetivorans (strain ATCC 35395 / DSM 2834 / JCM 12185 / C2A) TaxID=188937 RepID=Q8TI53_METAC|nr:predicted protein [Methanosarcina acetivorans C2A]
MDNCSISRNFYLNRIVEKWELKAFNKGAKSKNVGRFKNIGYESVRLPRGGEGHSWNSYSTDPGSYKEKKRGINE